MAQTRVFVDDAVLGQLPQVCAKDGVPTGSRLTIDQEIGATSRVGVLWLLLLLGPLGWLALLFLMARDSGDHLVIDVPLSATAYDRLRSARWARNRGIAIAVIGAVVGLLLASQVDVADLGPVLVGAALVIGGGIALTGGVRVARESIAVSLDGSRRWVTLGRVHPAFAAACDAQVEAARRAGNGRP
jgi:hypothetical protein